MSVLDWYPS